DGIVAKEGEHSLKANKRGTRSLINPKLPSLSEVKLLESNPREMYELIRAKTLYTLGHSVGHDFVNPAYYNAVFKDLKMRHGLRITAEDGTVTLLSADEAIAQQREGSLPDGETELVVLSDRTVKTLLGEQDTHGLQRTWTEAPTVDSAGVRPWR